MKNWLYKWLPIICGCHCREERSFHYKGERFPICARCTGELMGMVVSAFSCFFFRLPLLWAILIMLPMIVDGFVQMFTVYESNNMRRFTTGFLFGFGLVTLFVIHTIFLYEIGLNIGRHMNNNLL